MTDDIDQYFHQLDGMADSSSEYMSCLDLGLKVGSVGWDVQQSFIIKSLVPAGALMSIYGPSGSYKSFQALSWGCHIAAGIDWDGRKVEQGSVLYVAGEGGPQVAKRIKAWEKESGVEVPGLVRVDRPVLPSEREEQQFIIACCRAIEEESGMPVKMIVFDTLARCFGGNDENSARDMGAFIHGCDVIKQAVRASVLIIHHTGKAEDKGARGSSALRAALDCEYYVTKEDPHQMGFSLSCMKMKDSEPPKDTGYELKIIDLCVDEDGDKVTSLVVIPDGSDVLCRVRVEGRKLSQGQAVLWGLIRARIESKHPCTRALVRDDFKAAEGKEVPHFGRLLKQLCKKELIELSGNDITLGSKSGELAG